jgi:hypothetical protein
MHIWTKSVLIMTSLRPRRSEMFSAPSHIGDEKWEAILGLRSTELPSLGTYNTLLFL